MGWASDTDIAVSIGIAVVVILIALFVWPGFARIRPNSIAGYWISKKTGNMYEIRPAGGRKIKILSKSGETLGKISGFYKIQAGGEGRVSIGRRQISWSDDTWNLQGIR